MTTFTGAAGAVFAGPGLDGGFLSQRQGRSSRGLPGSPRVPHGQSSPSSEQQEQVPLRAQDTLTCCLALRPPCPPALYWGMCPPCSVHPPLVPAQVAGCTGAATAGLPLLRFLVIKDRLCVSHTRQRRVSRVWGTWLWQVSFDWSAGQVPGAEGRSFPKTRALPLHRALQDRRVHQAQPGPAFPRQQEPLRTQRRRGPQRAGQGRGWRRPPWC